MIQRMDIIHQSGGRGISEIWIVLRRRDKMKGTARIGVTHASLTILFHLQDFTRMIT